MLCSKAKSACRFALVEPVQSHTKLSVSEEGLEVIRNIPGPVIPVVVIGPYRSGKSFLLNQLLGVGCSKSILCAIVVAALSYARLLMHAAAVSQQSAAFSYCCQFFVNQ